VKTYQGIRRPGGLRVVVNEGGTLTPLRHHVRHSPTGFECGYYGSGPADLARCILIDHLQPPAIGMASTETGRRVERLYQDFKAEVVAELDRSGFDLSAEKIDEWLEGR
jgi:hypothetical protein